MIAMCIWFLEKFQEIGLYTKLECVCELHQYKIEFLGYVMSRNDILRDPCKVQTIIDWVTPTFVQDV